MINHVRWPSSSSFFLPSSISTSHQQLHCRNTLPLHLTLMPWSLSLVQDVRDLKWMPPRFISTTKDPSNLERGSFSLYGRSTILYEWRWRHWGEGERWHVAVVKASRGGRVTMGCDGECVEGQWSGYESRWLRLEMRRSDNELRRWRVILIDAVEFHWKGIKKEGGSKKWRNREGKKTNKPSHLIYRELIHWSKWAMINWEWMSSNLMIAIYLRTNSYVFFDTICYRIKWLSRE